MDRVVFVCLACLSLGTLVRCVSVERPLQLFPQCIRITTPGHARFGIMNSPLSNVVGNPSAWASAKVWCHILQGDRIDFDEIRNQMIGTTDLSIMCEPGGRLYLPVPMKSANIVKISVTGCTIEGYMSQVMWTNITEIPDILRSLKIVDSVIEVDMMDMLRTALNRSLITREAECGQQTLETYVIRNVTYDVRMTTPISPETIMSVMGDFVTSEPIHNCTYSNLKYVDESQATSTSSHHFRLLTAGSTFPALQYFNVSSSGLNSVPQAFKDWRLIFPQLIRLDLSHNNIAEPSFTPYASLMGIRQEPLYVNLRYNNITTLPRDFLDNLVPPATVLDLRNNPIDCTEYGATLRQYVGDVVAVDATYSFLYQDFPCPTV